MKMTWSYTEEELAKRQIKIEVAKAKENWDKFKMEHDAKNICDSLFAQQNIFDYAPKQSLGSSFGRDQWKGGMSYKQVYEDKVKTKQEGGLTRMGNIDINWERSLNYNGTRPVQTYTKTQPIIEPAREQPK